MRTMKIALAPGDGAAPEMMKQATLTAAVAAEIAGVQLVFVETPMGWSAFEQHGDTFPRRSFETASQCEALFFGGVGEQSLDATIGQQRPDMKPEQRCLLGLRGGWGLLLNFRPVLYLPELRHLALAKDLPEQPVEQHWIRFLLEDSYFGLHDLGQYFPADVRSAVGLKPANEVNGSEERVTELAYYSRPRLEAYFRYVCEYAAREQLPLLCVDKANMMGRYRLWRQVCHEQASFQLGLHPKYVYVDTACMMLFHPAKLHGVIACGNEHGDILTDGAAECWGSMGMMHSASINPSTGKAMFESGAGTAPDLKGQDVANPLGRILTAGLMLRHLGLTHAAELLKSAVYAVLADGYRTKDIARSDDTVVGCAEMGRLVRQALKRAS